MIPLPQLRDPAPGDGCGPCTACCDVLGVADLGKPYYARCRHLGEKHCDAYEERPKQCSDFRCAWHLGFLGPRTDRRPNECGVIFQFDQHRGKWILGIYEVVPGAASAEKTMFLARMILTSKKVRHLTMGQTINVFPFGSDIPVAYPIADVYDVGEQPIDKTVPLKAQGTSMVFAGKTRGLLMPKFKE